jgi:hypothetical protein
MIKGSGQEKFGWRPAFRYNASSGFSVVDGLKD